MALLFVAACGDDESSFASATARVDVEVLKLENLDTVVCDETSEGLVAYV